MKRVMAILLIVLCQVVLVAGVALADHSGIVR